MSHHLFGEPARYLDPFTDFGFKRLFGTEANKDLLIEFLNALLELKSPIVNLTYRPTEKIGDIPTDRKAVFDIFCTSKDGESFIVEMQKAKQNYFIDRSVFYASFLIKEQALKGKWNYELKPVYMIGILDFVFDEDKKENLNKYKHIVKMKDDENKIFYDKLTYVYLEMPRFNKAESELITNEDKWLYVLKNLTDFENRPDRLKERIFKKFFTLAEISNLKPAELADYETSLKYYRDYYNTLDASEQKGREEGRQEGIIEGMKKEEKKEYSNPFKKCKVKK